MTFTARYNSCAFESKEKVRCLFIPIVVIHVVCNLRNTSLFTTSH